MKTERIYQLIEQCRHAISDNPNTSLLDSYIKKISEELGYHYYLFGLSTPKNMNQSDHFILNNYPVEWRIKYDENQYTNKDPVVLHCLKKASPILWTQLRKNLICSEQVTIMTEASSYGLVTGFSIPIHGIYGEKGVLSLASSSTEESKNVIQEIAMATLLSTTLYDLFKHHFQTKKAKPSALFSRLKTFELTEKEKSCLTWVADGKSSWEIAQILGCSERTINFHLQNAREKLNTFTRTQTVSQALLTGQISPRVETSTKSY